MIISDLNYLESVDEKIVGGQGIQINSDFYVDKYVNANVYEDYYKRFYIDNFGVYGNTAEVIGTADAHGVNTFTSAIGGTQTHENQSSESFLELVSVSA